jgi:hypothetical protein
LAYLSIHPEVDDWIAAGVEECEEENGGVDGSMVVQKTTALLKFFGVPFCSSRSR